MNFIKKAALKVVKNELDDYIQKFLSGEDVPDSNNNTGDLTSKTAMKYSAVFACVRVLAETYASVPIMEYRKDSKGDRTITTDTSAYDILHNQPNEEMSPFNFKETSMINLNLGGNAVAEKLVNRNGELVGLYPYQWDKIQIVRDQTTNKLIYRIRDGSKSKELKRVQVYHVPGLSFDGVVGLTPIQYSASPIKLGLTYEQFGINFYKNGALTSGIFEHPGALGDLAYDRLKKELKKNYRGLANAGTPMILEEGMKYQGITINPVDAQLIENKRFQVEDICRIYRVPQHLVQMLERSTNNNIEHQSLEFIMYTMLPWFKRNEENANMQLLTSEERKAGYYLEHKIDSLLRGDAVSRATAYATGRQWGWLSVNDIRRLENINPIQNGDIYLQPLNMGEAGKIQQQDQVKAMTESIYKMITERSDIG